MTITSTGLGIIVLSIMMIVLGFYFGTMFTWKSMSFWMKKESPSKHIRDFGETLIEENNSFSEIFSLLIKNFRL